MGTCCTISMCLVLFSTFGFNDLYLYNSMLSQLMNLINSLSYSVLVAAGIVTVVASERVVVSGNIDPVVLVSIIVVDCK
jgi:hypothetical protein